MATGLDDLAEGLAINVERYSCPVVFSDGITTIVGLLAGGMAAPIMLDAGYADKRQNRLTVQASEFLRVTKPPFVKNDKITVQGQRWVVSSVNDLIDTAYTFDLVQDW